MLLEITKIVLLAEKTPMKNRISDFIKLLCCKIISIHSFDDGDIRAVCCEEYFIINTSPFDYIHRYWIRRCEVCGHIKGEYLSTFSAERFLSAQENSMRELLDKVMIKK